MPTVNRRQPTADELHAAFEGRQRQAEALIDTCRTELATVDGVDKLVNMILREREHMQAVGAYFMHVHPGRLQIIDNKKPLSPEHVETSNVVHFEAVVAVCRLHRDRLCAVMV